MRALDARHSLSVWGNVGVMSLLLVIAVVFARLHASPWWLAAPDASATWIAGGIVATYIAFTAWCLRPRGSAVDSNAAAGKDVITVVHASQTGFAQVLAERSAKSLRAAGLAVVSRSLETVTAEDLSGRMLFIASTTGEGDPPDHALGFVRRVMSQTPDLHGLHYAVLALGDREYDHFCGFGIQLDDWLRQHGAQPLFDRVDVDNADESALRHWQHHLGQLGGVTDLPDWDTPRYETWRLSERRLLNPGSVGGPAYHLALQPPDGLTPAWQAGDLVEIGPRNSMEVVASFLRSCGWEAGARISVDGEVRTLGDVLAERQLPPPGGTHGRNPEQLLETLPRLAHREYSIASIPEDGSIELLVRLMQRPDGQAGLGSGWLCLHAPIGGNIDVRIRRNANFHAPAAPVPMILIGNGTGLAGLRAHIKQRAAQGVGRIWLMFGERSRAHDFFHQPELEAWQRAGVIERMTLAFSRDQPERRYVQDEVRAAAVEIRQWVEAGAAIHVCGSLDGMAPRVDVALIDVLGEAVLDALRVSGRYRRDVY